MKSSFEETLGVKSGWDPTWEEKIYGQGRHLNLYPHHSIVSYLFRKYPVRSNRQGVRVLEVGCGAGNNLWFAAREGFSVSGIDGSSSAIDFATQRFKNESLDGEFTVGDFQKLPWEDQQFDIVFDRQSILCNKRNVIENTFKEINRVLKPGGYFFSMMYSDHHPEIKNGKHIGGNTYDHFNKGYFKDCGLVHFSPESEIESLYGSVFSVRHVVHVAEDEYLVSETDNQVIGKRPLNGYWRIECCKSE